MICVRSIIVLAVAVFVTAGCGQSDDKSSNEQVKTSKSVQANKDSKTDKDTQTGKNFKEREDFYQYDISGVKLGMTWDKAMQVVKQKYGVSEESLKQSGHALVKPTFYELRGLKYNPNDDTPTSFSYTKEDNSESISVNFYLRVPLVNNDLKASLIVSDIEYKTVMNTELFRQAIAEKYGKYSYEVDYGKNYGNNFGLVWCGNGSVVYDGSSKKCTNNKEDLFVGNWLDNHIKLSAVGLYEEVQAAIQKKSEDRVKTPSF
jgi:hypothetical protein